MRRKIEKLLIAVVLLIIGLKANNTAGKAIDSNNITATASSVYISGGDGYIYGPQYTIDKSGLNRRGYHDIYALDMWMSNYDGGGNKENNPVGVKGAAWLKYEFDQPYELGETWIWNCNFKFGGLYTKRGLRNIFIHYSVDGSTWVKIGEYMFPQAPDTDYYAGFATSIIVAHPHIKGIDIMITSSI